MCLLVDMHETSMRSMSLGHSAFVKLPWLVVNDSDFQTHPLNGVLGSEMTISTVYPAAETMICLVLSCRQLKRLSDSLHISPVHSH